MEMTEEEFDQRFADTLDQLVETMAENPEIDPHKFYNMACILENLRFFSPVIYSTLLKGKK